MVNGKLYDILNEELSRQASNVKELEPGSEEEKRVIENITQLSAAVAKCDDISYQHDAEFDNQEIEREKVQVEREKNFDDWFRFGIELLVTTSVSVMMYNKTLRYNNAWKNDMFEFERYGRICGSASKELVREGLRLPNFGKR